jgi:peptide subunit release factor 1 (eRF1)
MITPSTINSLKSYERSNFQIMTVYLSDAGMRAPSGEYLLSQFHSLVHRYLDKAMRIEFAEDIDRIQKSLREHTPKARSLVIFSAGDKLWRVVSLEFALPASLTISTSPHLDPLLQALPQYSRYLVLLVDREKARMFTVEQGEMINHAEYIGDNVPQKTKSTGRDFAVGGSDASFRYNEVLLQRHIDKAAQAVAKFTRSQTVHFVIIGGHSEMFKRVAASLPPGLRSKVLNNFVTEINIPLNDIMIESKKIAATVTN